MKNSLSILLVLVALAALLAAGYLLFSDPVGPHLPIGPIERPGTGGAVVETPEAPPDEEPLEPLPPDPEIEKIAVETVKPESKWIWKPVDVTVSVIDLHSLKPVPFDAVSFRVLQNDLLLPAVPRPGSRAGDFSFGALIPGRYRFEAETAGGRRGVLGVQIEPGLSYDRNLYVAPPAPLELKVVRAQTGNPIVGAVIDSADVVSRGRTDERGLFRSKRPVIADPDLAVSVSKDGYFTTLFHPFADSRIRGGKGSMKTVALKPLGGSARFSGTIEDQEGNPLQRWKLRLASFASAVSRSDEQFFYDSITDSKGEFAFKDLAPGEYVLEGVILNWVGLATDPFTSLFSTGITIPGGRPLENQKIVCSLTPLKIAGIVLRADELEPVSGVRIACNAYHAAGIGGPADPLHFEAVVTDGAGNFTLGREFLPTEIDILLQRTGLRLEPPGGEWEVFRIHPGSSATNIAIGDLLSGAPVKLWLRVSSKMSLSGRVVDAHGKGLKGVIVEANPMVHSDRRRNRAMTNMNGGFVLNKLFAGSWSVKVRFPSGPEQEKYVTLAADRTPEPLEFAAPGGCRLEGNVDLTDAEYFPRISIDGEGFLIENVRLRRSGQFAFEHLPAGKAVITVESYATQRFEEKSLRILKAEVELEEGTTTTVSL